MKIKIILIILLSSLCVMNANAQWKKVLDLSSKKAGGAGPFISFKSNIIVGTDIGTYISSDSGITWKKVDSSSAMSGVVKYVATDSLIFANTYDAGIYYSNDSGNTWHITDITPSNSINDIILSGNNLLACSLSKIYLSSDYGKHWTVANKGIPSSPPSVNARLYPFVNIGNKTIVFYGQSSFISSDQGNSWNHIGDSCKVDMAILNVGNYIYSAQGNGDIYESKDSSLTWQKTFTPSPSYSTLLNLFTDGKNIIAALPPGGVVLSRDSGQNWRYINDGLSTLWTLDVMIQGNYIYCSANNGLIFKRSLGQVTGEIIMKNKIFDVLNIKVYPNPLQQSTTFDFGRLLKDGQIIIYDMAGKEVSRISKINTEKTILQRNGLTSATYIYLLLEGNKKLAQGKLIIQ